MPCQAAGVMTISTTIATKKARVTDMRTPTSHNGAAAGSATVRRVAGPLSRNVRATSNWRGCTDPTAPAVLSTIGHNAA